MVYLGKRKSKNRKMKWKLPAYKSDSVNALIIIFEIERGSHFFVIIAQQD